MWADRDDFSDLIFIEGLNVLQSQHLKYKFITSPARRISRAHFLVAQDCEGNGGLVEYFDKFSTDLLTPVVETSGTPHPKQQFGLFTCSHHFSHRFHFHILHFSFINFWV